MADPTIGSIRRRVIAANTRMDTIIDHLERDWVAEAVTLLRNEKKSISSITEEMGKVINDRITRYKKQYEAACVTLSSERYKHSQHPTTELVEHAIIHAQELAEMVDMDEHGSEVRATMGLLKILLDESNGIKPPKCGYLRVAVDEAVGEDKT